MTPDFTKPVQTRDGQKVRIICTDADNIYPIIGLLRGKNGKEVVYAWRSDGVFHDLVIENELDLQNVPDEKWVNLYKTVNGYTTGAVHASEETAKAEINKLSKYVKTIRVE